MPRSYYWYGRQDLNLHGYPLEPKSNVSANSTTPACVKLRQYARVGVILPRSGWVVNERSPGVINIIFVIFLDITRLGE